MKNQYFGDKNDYIKYALIRRLIRHNDVNAAICWMMTESDKSGDTRNIHYLREPFAQLWSPIDEDLFKCLQKAVCVTRQRNVRVIKDSGLLGDTCFYQDKLPKIPEERRKYFQEFLIRADGRKLVFFDPDTGIKPDRWGYNDSPTPEHLYLSEVADALKNHSLLVYQHEARGKPIEHAVLRLRDKLFKAAKNARQVHVFYAASVAVGLMLHPDHTDKFTNQIEGIKEEWAGFVHAVSFFPDGDADREA